MLPESQPQNGPLESVSQHPLVDAAALETLQRAIMSHIDVRHHELRSAQEGLFEKFRTELTCVLQNSNTQVDEKQTSGQQQKAQSACQKGKSSLIAGLRDGSLNRIVDDMEASKNASAPQKPTLQNFEETDGVRFEYVASKPEYDVCDDFFDCFGSSRRYASEEIDTQSDTGQYQVATMHPALSLMPTTPKEEFGFESHFPDGMVDDGEVASPVVEHPAEPELRSSINSSFVGLARGAFKGRPNLFAFMQAKNWDSQAAEKEELEHEFSSEQFATGPWSKFKAVINSSGFDLIVATFIFANALVMALRLEYEALVTADQIDLDRDYGPGHWPKAKESFDTMEHIFAISFLVELLLRVAVMGCTYFHQPLNWMDVFIVVIGILEMYVLTAFANEGSSNLPNLTFLRLLRIFKIMRVLRIIRVLKFFEKLRVLVAAVSHSLGSLMWSMLLLGVVILICSIFMTQSLQSYLQDENNDFETRDQIYVFFGSFSRSCLTLFEMTLAAGTWGRCGRTVIFSVNQLYAIFFFGYLAFVSFAMIRVIAAIFLKDTLASSANDNEKVMSELNKDPKYVNRIRRVFKEMDLDGNGQINQLELLTMLEDDRCQRWMSELGIRAHEVKGLFTLMDDGDDEISWCEWLTGIMRLKNSGKGVDLATLLYENKKLLSRILKVGYSVEKLRSELGFLDANATWTAKFHQTKKMFRGTQKPKLNGPT